jgi:SPP1 family predicted phage head-tail adaptor
VWARTVALKGLEKWASQQTKAELHERYEIRYRDDITPGENRFLFEGRTYDIHSVVEITRRQGLELTASVHI